MQLRRHKRECLSSHQFRLLAYAISSLAYNLPNRNIVMTRGVLSSNCKDPYLVPRKPEQKQEVELRPERTHAKTSVSAATVAFPASPASTPLFQYSSVHYAFQNKVRFHALSPLSLQRRHGPPGDASTTHPGGVHDQASEACPAAGHPR